MRVLSGHPSENRRFYIAGSAYSGADRRQDAAWHAAFQHFEQVPDVWDLRRRQKF